MKKIILLVPTLNTGGGERVASELSMHLGNDFDVKLVLFRHEVIYPHKGEIISLNICGKGRLLFKIFSCIRGLIAFRSIVRKYEPDYVISFGHASNLINIFSGARAVLRVDNFYSSSCRGLSGKLYSFLVRNFFNRAFTIVAVSKESAEDLIKNFGIKPQKIRVIYNLLDTSKIQKLALEPLEREYEDIFKKPVFINMGQLGIQKNHRQLIESFKAIKKEIPESKLVILGQGALENDLKTLSQKMGISDDVHFLGWQKNPFKFLANSKVFVLSSLWEGLPYVLIEAMACGLPIVSFDCKSGPREILAGRMGDGKTRPIEFSEYGILVESGKTKKLAEAAVSLFKDTALYERMKKSSQKRAMDFDYEKIISEWNFLKNKKINRKNTMFSRIKDFARKNTTIMGLYKFLIFVKNIPLKDYFNISKLFVIFKVYPFSMAGYKRIANVYDLASLAEKNNLDGAFAECGVWKGGCSAVMAYVSKKNKSMRKIWLFDSFEGLPEPTPEDGEVAKEYSDNKAQGKLNTINKCVGPLEEVKKIFFDVLKINPKNVVIEKGWFQNTLPKAKEKIGKISILRLDGDWYESTKCCLENLYDNVIVDGYIIIDDYGHWEGAKKALNEFFDVRKITPKLEKIDYTGVYFRKP